MLSTFLLSLVVSTGIVSAGPNRFISHFFTEDHISSTPKYEYEISHPLATYDLHPSVKPISEDHISSTPKYEYEISHPLATYDLHPSVKPISGSGFWGLPPPPDSPFMGSVSTPIGILFPPTAPAWEVRREDTSPHYRGPGYGCTTPREDVGLRERTSSERTGGGDDWSPFGKAKHPKEEKPAKKWCSRYQSNCKSTKREANELSIRITGGSPAPPKEHPHMVMIGYGPKSNKQWLCGGSLISERYVLSAAHCVNTTKMGQARWARLGDLDISTSREDAGPQEMEIVERIVHPGYKEPAVYNDIVLFRLDREITFTPWVSPVCLQTDEKLSSTTRATITGWGRTDFVSETSPALMEVDVRVFNSSRCKTLVDASAGPKMPKGYDSSTMICAGEEGGGKDACQGDSGGPLVVDGDGCAKVQIGITSVGKECGLPDSPGVYTRVQNYVSWIEGVVWRDG